MSPWQLPIGDHNGSQLMSLPPELRLLILREVLVDKAVLVSELELDSPKNGTHRFKSQAREQCESAWIPGPAWPTLQDWRRAHPPPRPSRPRIKIERLDPRILATCQDLYAEGLPILFEEYTLQILRTDAVEYRQIKGRKFPDANTLGPFTIISALPENIEQVLQHNEAVPLSIQTLLRKFRRFAIVLDLRRPKWSGSDHVMQLAEKLASCVHTSSHITLHLRYLDDFWWETPQLTELLNPFKLLRGSHFRLATGYKYRIPIQLEQSMYREITSNTPSPRFVTNMIRSYTFPVRSIRERRPPSRKLIDGTGSALR